MRAWASVVRLGSVGTCVTVLPARLGRTGRLSAICRAYCSSSVLSSNNCDSNTLQLSHAARKFGSFGGPSSLERLCRRHAASKAHPVAAVSSSVAEVAQTVSESWPATKAKQQSVRERAALSQLGSEPFDLDRWAVNHLLFPRHGRYQMLVRVNYTIAKFAGGGHRPLTGAGTGEKMELRKRSVVIHSLMDTATVGHGLSADG